ncbi:ADP-ribosylglycohydrolase family protein [Kitasatospora sp. NPDC096140]|uniref:ADP-ribosylglycohydrolase family protein n=1 Tax=Kitasatospora sp. NPDC096140 TaxID=3155425 RepID=UPI00332AB5E2
MRAAGPVLDSLQGLALGDAFGDRWFSVPVDEAPVALAARLTRPAPWHWTDDTAMALVLVRHLAAHGEVRQDALAGEFAAEYTREYGRKYGPSMHRVLRGIGAGGDWRAITAGQFEGQGSYGNGAAMRVAPLGAWFADDLDAVARQAELQALTTHFHPEAVVGSVAVALAAALAVRSRGGTPPGRAALLTEVAGRLPDSDVRSGLRIAARLPEHTSVRHAAGVLGSGALISAPDTVPFALWSAAGHPDSLPEALWHTLEGWGDQDTTCAIAAGVVAARTGLADVPAAWLDAREALPAWVTGTADGPDAPDGPGAPDGPDTADGPGASGDQQDQPSGQRRTMRSSTL